ncbi:MAG: hypothetical protein VX741_00410, partial [Pseudomonadota bacterium]|nr:hypothetical protein [Pseudomonadota bacterium]
AGRAIYSIVSLVASSIARVPGVQTRLCIIAVLVDAVRNALITANKRGKSNPLLTGFGRHVTLATEKYHMGDP